MAPGDMPSPHVKLARDRMSAHLVVPAELSRGLLNESLCWGVLMGAGVELGDMAREAIQQLVNNPPPPGKEHAVLIAQGTPPRHGTPGRIHWLVTAPAPDPNAPALNHYERSAFLHVQPQQVIARVVQPVNGSDGRDVTGKTLPARQPPQFKLPLDETVILNARGELVAQIEGVLIRSDEAIKISRHLVIDDSVDFSTGNIHFNGDVTIRRSIQDRFLVEATGWVMVEGLLQAAEIRCGGDLIARGGFAGKERGKAQVGGKLIARYLDNVEAHIKGDLIVDRELLNSELVVGGAVRSPGAHLMGGRLRAAREVILATLGSEAGVATRLDLGSIPRLEGMMPALNHVVAELQRQWDDLNARVTPLRSSKRLTSEQKEALTELNAELTLAEQRLRRGHEALQALQRRLDRLRRVELAVASRVHTGVTLGIAGVDYRFDREVRGPLKVTLGVDRKPLARIGDAPTLPLVELLNRAA